MPKNSASALSIALIITVLLASPAVASDPEWTEAPLGEGSADSAGTEGFPILPPGHTSGGPDGEDGAADGLGSDVDEMDQVYPEGFDIQGSEPETLYFGDQPVSYTTYRSILAGANSLWIEGDEAWSQYTVCPLGGTIPLVATTPDRGVADFYEIYPEGITQHDRYMLDPYSHVYFYGNTPGQHILLFVKDSQPSNAVIVEVASGDWWPDGTGSGTVPGASAGLAQVTIISDWLKGFGIVVDDSHYYSDDDDGLMNGHFSFTVPGNANHKIAISKGGYHYTQMKYFVAGRSYTLRIS